MPYKSEATTVLKAVEVQVLYRLDLTFCDDATLSVYLSAIINRTPALAPLKNKELFSRACVGDWGLTVDWIPGELDMAGDNLRTEAAERSGGISHERIWEWMHRNGLTFDSMPQRKPLVSAGACLHIIGADRSKFQSISGWPACIVLILVVLIFVFGSTFVHASDVNELAACTIKIFKEINRTHKWSGKSPTGCPSTVAVERRPEGAFVTIWQIEKINGGWINTAFSAAEGYWEVARKKDLAKANRDIMSRAKRLAKCLDSVIATNDPLECRQRSTKSYHAGETTGTDIKKIIWLNDGGRHAVIEFSYGDSVTEPFEPADIIETSPLPNGMIINVIPQLGGGGSEKSSASTPGTSATSGIGILQAGKRHAEEEV